MKETFNELRARQRRESQRKYDEAHGLVSPAKHVATAPDADIKRLREIVHVLRIPLPVGYLSQKDADAIDRVIARLAEVEAGKDVAYAERNKMVAFFSCLFPSSLERHDGEDWEDDWRWVVFVSLPSGQVSWHIHDSELPMFDHVPRLLGEKWDGHTTEEKYQRVLRLIGLRYPDQASTPSARIQQLEAVAEAAQAYFDTREFVATQGVRATAPSEWLPTKERLRAALAALRDSRLSDRGKL